MKNETRTNFTVINGTEPESINIAEWQKEYPRYCAIVERDPNKDGYGWIRYRGSRPFPYSLTILCEAGNYNNELHCDPHNCYEIVPKDYKVAKKGTKLSPERMREVTKAMNK